MKQDIYITECKNYEQDTVQASINNIFALIGGIDKIINPGERVFLKLNLLKKNSPEEAVTTHPSIVEEVVKHIQNAGGKVTIGDSPGGPYTVNILKAIYATTGMKQISERTGCQLNYDISSKNVATNGMVSKNLEIISPVLDYDKVIAIGKLKTHSLMTATMSVKLCFGYIPGLIKADYHLRMPKPDDFANLLIDIYEHRKPDLCIIDAVYGMEGDGPSAGNPIHVGCIVAGINGHAVDTLCAEIMSIPTNSIPTIKQAAIRGLFSGKLEDINVIGDNFTKYKKIFKHPNIRNIDPVNARIPKIFRSILNNKLKAVPIINRDKCKGCGICSNSCPAKTIDISNDKAIIKYDKCISCFCCHELCPIKAINIKKPLISRLMTSKLKK